MQASYTGGYADSAVTAKIDAAVTKVDAR